LIWYSGLKEDSVNSTVKQNTIDKVLTTTYAVLAFCILIVLFVIIKDNISACMEIYPREYRDSANMSIARSFYDGFNPYLIPKSGPLAVNVYGFINPLLAVGLAKISGIGLLNSFYVFNLLASFGFCFLVAWEVFSLVKQALPKKRDNAFHTSNEFLGNVIMFETLLVISYTLTFRVGHISTVPDALGMTLSVAILMIARRSKTNKAVVLVALLLVLEFYIKAYFLFYAAPVFIYYLIKDRKKLIVYVVSGLTIGIASILIVNAVFPLYFAETVYFEFIEQFLDAYAVSVEDMAAYEREYMIFQFTVLIKKYFPVIAIAAAVIITSLISLLKKEFISEQRKGIISDLTIYIITVCISIPTLMFLGKNDGAYMSYHFQLMMPWVLILTYNAVIRLYNEALQKDGIALGDKYRIPCLIFTISLLFVMTASAYLPYKAFGKVKLLTDEAKTSWEQIESICLQAVDNGENIFPGTLVSGLIMDRRSYYFDNNGHTYLTEVDDEDVEAVQNNQFITSVFDDLADMYSYAAKQNDVKREMFKSGGYDLIIADDVETYEKVNEDGYTSEKIVLNTGYFDNEVTVYRKKR